jgi:PKD repeat protein
MERHSSHSPGDVMFFSCLLLLAICFLMQPVNMWAQTGSSRFTSLLSESAQRIQVAFAYSPTYPKAGQIVQFVDNSKDRLTSRTWDFGDGTTSVVQNPSHSFSTPGFYKVTLTGSNGSGSNSLGRTISVMPSNAAAFTFSPASPRAGQLIQFTDATTGSSTSWKWHFGDGTTSTAKNPIHAYGVAAAYNVTLVVSDSSGSKNASQTVTVAPSPVLTTLSVSFIYSPASPKAGQTVQFTDTSSGSPTSWLWNFGDGTTSTVQNPSHSFTTAATYTVSFTATGSSGSKNSSQTITVFPALAASFAYSPVSPVAGQAVQFTDTSTGNPTAWLWNFNDGISSTAQNPSHTFATAGSYNVTLSVNNGAGSKSLSKTINIVPASTLTANFSYSPSSPVLGQVVYFADASTGSPTSWQWSLGDGATSTDQNPSHSYITAGSYDVTLTITAGSNSNSTTRTITVERADTITAASASLADVRTAIASVNPGDTVIVPAGSATWGGQLVITKGIYLIGAGAGNTVITSNYNPPSSGNPSLPTNYLVAYLPAIPAANEPLRLSGFTFDCANRCFFMMLQNTTTTPVNQIRVDDNTLRNTKRAFAVRGPVYGVIDNNIGENTRSFCTMYGLNETSWNNIGYQAGTADAMFLEDNVTQGEDFVAGGAGMRVVVRHNTCTYNGTASLSPWCEGHGNMLVGGNLGTQGFEMYENKLYFGVPGTGVRIFDNRGGSAIVFNNTVYTSGGATTVIREEYPDSWCPPVKNGKTGQPQYPSDSYFWGNRRGVDGTIPVDVRIDSQLNYDGTGYCTTHPYESSPRPIPAQAPYRVVPQEDKEFWAEKASFNGTAGIGVGPLSARPTTCTKGVAYWATDTRTLYKSTAANTWNAYYTPYVYPHPLRRQF